jgi:hypothetical protein
VIVGGGSMFADIPFQGTLDLDAIFSRFDDQTNPANVTTWEDSSVDVVFKAATPPLAHPANASGHTDYPRLRTIGHDGLVDEFVFKFTHTLQKDWLLPGAPPTNKPVEVVTVVVVQF